MPNPEILLPTAKGEVVQTSVSIEQASLDWLNQLATDTNRTRSDVLREILRNVRAQTQQTKKAS